MCASEKVWALLQIVNDETEAHLLQGLLQGQGIPCHIQSMRVPQYPLTIDGLGEIHVYVPEEELLDSKTLLATFTGRPVE
jgi:hypothetical protein